MTELRVEFAPNLQSVAAAYRAADPELRKQMRRALAEVAKPLGMHVRSAGSGRLPRRGGLAARVARARIGTTLGTSSRNPSIAIRLSTREGYNLRLMNAGKLRHPVFARSDRTREQWAWVSQEIEPDAFARAFDEGAPEVRRAAMKALQAVLDDVARKV